MEPYRLRRWNERLSTDRLAFYTCARPGRSKSASDKVADEMVYKWLQGLPGDEKVAIVSLLGRKQDGMSEFWFYSFCSAFESPEERRRRPTFAEWIDESNQDRPMKVVEHPTIDFEKIPCEILDAVERDVRRLLEDGWTVILVDSGGMTRTDQVCKHLQFVQDSRTL